MERRDGERPDGERREPAPPAAEILDVRGLLCPIPVLRAAARLRDLPAGARVEVVGDDPAIVEDLPVWCRRTGNRLVTLERNGELVRCVVEKVG
jgi:tRNA 2-thiouridine synthesizing protein A